MMDQKQVETEFRTELEALLKKWGATLEVESYDRDSRGEVEVTIPSICDEEGNLVREHAYINLGKWWKP